MITLWLLLWLPDRLRRCLARCSGRSGEFADVGEREADEAVVAARHLSDDLALTASSGLNQARSSASCVGSHSPSTGTT